MSCYGNLASEKPPIIEWGDLIEQTHLTDIQKRAIRVRVLSVVKRLRDRLSRLTVIYTILRTSTTVGSLLVPSLLAVQSNVDQQGAYWAMWGIGLAVSLSNAFVSLFRVDKNYFTVGDLIEKIESESWMFLTLSGKYKQDELEEHETGLSGHQLMFHKFMERCEVMMNKAIRTEFTPGTFPGSNKSVLNDHSTFGLKKSVPMPVAHSASAPRESDPYETVPLPVDDSHNSANHSPSNSSDNVRRERVPSDTTTVLVPSESEPTEGGVSATGVVPSTEGSTKLQGGPQNERVLRHDREGGED